MSFTFGTKMYNKAIVMTQETISIRFSVDNLGSSTRHTYSIYYRFLAPKLFEEINLES